MAKVIKPLYFWVQKVLPLVYDDSLSYYEVLEKCIWKLNELIEQTNYDREQMVNLIDTAVNDAVRDKVPDIVFVKLQEMIGDGILYNMIQNIATVETQNYLAQLLDTSRIDYLETVNGEPILTVNGDYIILQQGDVPNAFTTNPTSYFYKYRQDAVNKVLAGKKPLNLSYNGYQSETPVLTMLHFSDPHGDNDEMTYIYRDWNSVIAECDDYICTGDLVSDRFNNRFDFFANSDDLAAKRTMLVIGNHDALADESGWDWTQVATEQQMYDKFFAPTIANWGVVYQEGKTYYYKDYPTHNIRLIVIDEMLIGADAYAQRYWLENTALRTDYNVVIARHYPISNPVYIRSTFTAININAMDSGNVTDIEESVQQFIGRGGKFICYICGHAHKDIVSYSSVYPSQLSICVDAASRAMCNAWSDCMRYDAQISRDLFNIIQFDTSTKTVKLIRCGCNYDDYLREKNTLSINYETKELIYN